MFDSLTLLSWHADGIVLLLATMLTAATTLSARRGRRSMWIAVIVLMAVFGVAQWIAPSGVLLYSHYCGRRCGERVGVLPSTLVLGVFISGLLLSLRSTRVSLFLLSFLSFLVHAALLLSRLLYSIS